MLKLALAVALATSLGVKLWTAFDPSSQPREMGAALVELDRVLTAQGWTVETDEYAAAPMIKAARAACRVMVLEARPQGWNAAAFAKLAGPDEALAYVYDGHVSTAPPFTRATLARFWALARPPVRATRTRSVLFALIANTQCRAEIAPLISRIVD